MNFHLGPGELTDEAPEVWGALRFSKYAGLWFVDWYSADGEPVGSSVADGEAYAWAERNPEAVAATRQAVTDWKIRLWDLKPKVPFDDEIPF